MAIVAPVSKYKVKTYLIYMAILVGFAAWLFYDGYYNQSFIEKHSPDDKPDLTIVFHRKAPPYLVGVAALLGVYALVIRGRKVVADDNALVINSKTTIPYDSIEKIDKTDFDKKGHFTFTYKTPDGTEIDRKISDRDYDNLKAVLDHLVAKIS
jgi:anaerobic selenocysteine-containing dehydrogenase